MSGRKRASGSNLARPSSDMRRKSSSSVARSLEEEEEEGEEDEVDPSCNEAVRSRNRSKCMSSGCIVEKAVSSTEKTGFFPSTHLVPGGAPPESVAMYRRAAGGGSSITGSSNRPVWRLPLRKMGIHWRREGGKEEGKL